MHNKKTLLFIDDDKHLTYVLNEFLINEGFDVVCAATAEEGIKALQSIQPDLIVLDISMPGIGGFGFLKHIAKEDGTSLYPVLVFTARAGMNNFFENVLVDGFIAKPCSELDLIRKIRSILDKHLQKCERSKHSILIAEDDKHMLPSYCKLLTHSGFVVRCVKSGPEIIEDAISNKPDLIIMKDILTGMNGRTVAKLLRSIPQTCRIPIIVHNQELPVGGSSTDGVDMFLGNSQPREILKAARRLLSVDLPCP